MADSNPQGLYAGLDERQRYELDRRCDHHPPRSTVQAEAHGRWRAAMKVLMAEAMRSLPPCRETSMVLTSLDDALMYGNAAIARPPMANGRRGGH
ncbi:hypothetical protein [Micromonospora sp. WMMD1082]|uniref:Acb2/Tad1 domain-containing protein n=1 Tax=Micromonospora sp. WMMD1082 TaxID=3016104 RepID=UPI0024179687|nr:hypothetical protein [Micromonospora sp. WMMD1082]MDG4796893.1 hypothetical protein [Micromonospora sp. WMMD1082]